MDKAPDAFRTISEVADYLETPAHVLRFWETRFPQVKPVKGAGGRRYYRPSDVALLAGIRRLLHSDGMTIRGVQKILRDQGVRHVAELGGEEVEPVEPLTALLPPTRPEAEVVPLRPEPARAEGRAEPLVRPTEMLPAMARSPEAARTTSEPQEPPAAKTAAPDAAGATPTAPAPAAPESPPPAGAFPGFGGFGLDLDAPQGGEGGFMAFNTAAGLPPVVEPPVAAPPVAEPPAPRPRRDVPRDGARQPSLFDLAAPEEDPVPEAPHIFVDTPDTPAEVTPLGFLAEGFAAEEPEAATPDEANAGFLAAGFADDRAVPEAAADALPDPQGLSAEDAILALLADAGETDQPEINLTATDLAAESPDLADTDTAADLTPDLADDLPPSVAPPDPEVPALAGLAPRLRALPAATPAALEALADLQARLGLLHAQMAEAATRPPRIPGA